jgi:Tfp pilus assembly protein PilO
MISVGIFFAYVNPTWSGSITTTKLAIASNTEALAAAGQYRAREDELAAQRDSIDPANLARLAVFLPDSVDNVGLILDINALAARSGLALSNVDVAANKSAAAAPTTDPNIAPSTSSDNAVGSIDLSLSAIGTYTALHAFLVGIEKSARLLDVRDIAVTGSDTGVYTYKMTIRLYWLR